MKAVFDASALTAYCRLDMRAWEIIDVIGEDLGTVYLPAAVIAEVIVTLDEPELDRLQRLPHETPWVLTHPHDPGEDARAARLQAAGLTVSQAAAAIAARALRATLITWTNPAAYEKAAPLLPVHFLGIAGDDIGPYWPS